jgi:hypothetical protein
VRALALAALLALGSVAFAQQWSVAVRYETPTTAAAAVTVEFPAINLLGFRAGPSVTLRGRYGDNDWSGGAQLGMTFAFIPRDPTLLAVLLETYYVATLHSARPMSHAFGVGLVIVGRLP